MVLFNCAICKYGHNVMDVSCFISKDNNYVYYCKEHKHLVPDTCIYVPWEDEKFEDDDYSTLIIRTKKDNTFIPKFIDNDDSDSDDEVANVALRNDLSYEKPKNDFYGVANKVVSALNFITMSTAPPLHLIDDSDDK